MQSWLGARVPRAKFCFFFKKNHCFLVHQRPPNDVGNTLERLYSQPCSQVEDPGYMSTMCMSTMPLTLSGVFLVTVIAGDQ